jgi:hypothetical protein
MRQPIPYQAPPRLLTSILSMRCKLDPFGLPSSPSSRSYRVRDTAGETNRTSDNTCRLHVRANAKDCHDLPETNYPRSTSDGEMKIRM